VRSFGQLQYAIASCARTRAVCLAPHRLVVSVPARSPTNHSQSSGRLTATGFTRTPECSSAVTSRHQLAPGERAREASTAIEPPCRLHRTVTRTSGQLHENVRANPRQSGRRARRAGSAWPIAASAQRFFPRELKRWNSAAAQPKLARSRPWQPRQWDRGLTTGYAGSAPWNAPSD
jgi:hypothetical protein